MARKRTFEETVTFETTGVDDGGDGGDDGPSVFLESAELSQTPDPNGKTTLVVTLGADEYVESAWFIADAIANDTNEEVAAFGGIEIPAGDDEYGQRQTIITAPEADEFDVRIKGGYETG